MSESYEERRQYKRIRKHFILNYYEARHPEHKFSATQLKNISRGGLCLVTDQAFQPGTILILEIKSPFFSSVTKMQGEVLQSHERAKDIIYETRVQFQDLSQEAADILSESVDFFTNKEKTYE